MAISERELEAMLSDTRQWIEGDLRWRPDEDHSPALQFRVEVRSEAGFPLHVNGRFNFLAGKLSYTLLHGSTGRVYALDLGSAHHNPTCQFVGDKHKHRWTDDYRDKLAYAAHALDPVAVWKQFCAEARIEHRGNLAEPSPIQMDFPV